MPGSSKNSSFIPKRGTSKHKRKVRKGGVYLLNIISNVALFAALAASAGVYFYSESVAKDFETEIANFNDATDNFKEADLRRVQDFDLRLDQASKRLINSVSISSIFSAIEAATAETVRFDSFSLLRNGDENFVIEATVFTDSFDSTIFQRDIYNDNDVVDIVEVVDVVLEQDTSAGEDKNIDEDETEEPRQGISFNAFLSVPVSLVPYDPDLADTEEEFTPEDSADPEETSDSENTDETEESESTSEEEVTDDADSNQSNS